MIFGVKLYRQCDQEALLLQGLDIINTLVFSIPAVLLGFILGRIVGGMKSLRLIDRVGFVLVVGGFGGLSLSFITGYFLNYYPVTIDLIVAILSLVSGMIFGAVTNWQSPASSESKSHIIFELDDEEEFDREIEEALGGKK